MKNSYYEYLWIFKYDEFFEFTRNEKKFDDWIATPRNMASKLTEILLRTLVAQFKNDK